MLYSLAMEKITDEETRRRKAIDAERQARYKNSQAARGYFQRKFWLTDKEHRALRTYLAALRKESPYVPPRGEPLSIFESWYHDNTVGARRADYPPKQESD